MPSKRVAVPVLIVLAWVQTVGAAAAQRADRQSYVALGDSYTAGPGIPVQYDPLGSGR